MSASPSQFSWNQQDPLARGRGEPEDAWRALCDYARLLGPGRSLEALSGLYKRESAVAKLAGDEGAGEQADLFGPTVAWIADSGDSPHPSLAMLGAWFETYAWRSRVAAWLSIQRGLAEGVSADERGRMLAEVIDSLRSVKEAAWTAWRITFAKGESKEGWLKIIIAADKALSKLLDLERWARRVRDDNPADAGEVVERQLLRAALPFADVVAESAGEAAAEEFLQKVRALIPSERAKEAGDDGC